MAPTRSEMDGKSPTLSQKKGKGDSTGGSTCLRDHSKAAMISSRNRELSERVLPPARSRGPLRPLSQESTLRLNSAPAPPKKRPPTAACDETKRRAPAENGRIQPPDLDSLYATTLRRKSCA
ncbi:hypothetical protein C4D60_Mb06t06190 [Musa balbisiana]|uniref:Uncharacterized protein n=1 Tax=Musa balbisiana TaxID=52838 RepID=A0A4S8IL18_MUSBA|nr:hypothetical protein C4D60_Mb06t06190 [Musa balbisiana]